MNRLLWPTELHRHSEVIISSGGAAVKRFWQKTWGGADSPIDGSESQFVHLRPGGAAGTVRVWRGLRRKPPRGWVRPSIWWNPAAPCGRPWCMRAAGACTPFASPIRAAASALGRTDSILPGTPLLPTCGSRKPASRSLSPPAPGTTCRCGSVERLLA